MKKLLFFSCLLVFFSSCREDIDDTMMGTSTDDPIVIIDDYDPDENIITGSVSGLIINENEEPIANASIVLRGTTYTTDDNGFFYAKDVQIDSEGTFYTVSKDGYFKGSRRFYPKAGAISNTKVQLMALNDFGQFNAAAGGSLSGSDGISVSFPENAIKKADGTLYEGMVNVSAKWLDPTASNVGDLMPGGLFGVNRLLEEVNLATYGMMAVELFGSNGELLNIADGKTAELSFPVPSDLITGAPSEIPLWSFEDAQYGVWVEEGKAVLTGDKYVGTVSHFSFWNCDAPFPLVTIEGRLITTSGQPIVDANVQVTIVGSGYSAWGYTDSDGTFVGKMPKDEELTITAGFYNVDCNFDNVDIGPFSMDQNIGDIVLGDAGDAFTVNGSVVDCDGNPVTNGRVRINVGGNSKTIYLDGDNTFDVAVLNCNNETDFTVIADDLDNLVSSSEETFTVAPTVPVGVINACGNALTEYFTLTVDGSSVTYPSANLWMEIAATGDYMFLSVNDSTGNPNGQQSFTLNMDSGLVGTYDASTMQYLEVRTSTPDFPSELTMFCQGGSTCTSLTTFTLEITEYGGVGGSQTGTLSGTGEFNDNTGQVISDVPFSAEWRLPIN